MRMNVTIRKMKKRDIPAVQEVAKVSWHSTYNGIIPIHIQENFLAGAYNVKMMKKRLRRTKFFVADVDSKIVGFANYSPGSSRGVVELVALYIYQEYHRQGIGTALLETGIDALGAKEVLLDVERANETALRFYHAKGFKKLSEFDEDFNGHILHTIRMSLKMDL